MAVRIHPTSVVDEKAEIGDGTQIWLFVQIRENVKIGKDCLIGKNVYIDPDVVIGDRSKLMNNVSVYSGVTIEDGVFCGPHCCFTNDKVPRAVNPDFSAKTATDWVLSPTRVKKGAALGANATIVCGVTIGEWAMVGSGAVVTRDVPAHALVLGNPARVAGWVCSCGLKVQIDESIGEGTCTCGRTLLMDKDGVRLAS
jgi:acetyltransferase-like isoleucine patch superfamily enzyme